MSAVSEVKLLVHSHVTLYIIHIFFFLIPIKVNDRLLIYIVVTNFGKKHISLSKKKKKNAALKL